MTDISKLLLQAMAGIEAQEAVEVRLSAVEQRLIQLARQNALLRDALVAEGLAVGKENRESAQEEPFALPDPVPLADRAPRNPRIARVVARLHAASAEEIAARAEKADEERYTIMKGAAGKP
jgi:hypothetical protein